MQQPSPTYRTTFPIPDMPFRIKHGQRIALLGSCFTQHIGQHLRDRKFGVLLNPFGVMYHPAAIARAMRGSFDFSEEQFFEQEGLWRHWDLHSELAFPDKKTSLEYARQQTQKTQGFLEQADILVLTLGTSEVFLRNETGEVVGNCHKMPSRLFSRKRMSVDETVAELQPAIEVLTARQPALKVVLTVSPVRHLRLGAVENQRSKAVLLLACEILANLLDNVVYFPAYELLMDDLRDYRFYGPDMVHPSDTAVSYIWEHFSRAFFAPETQDLIQKMEKINAAAAHRPFNPDTAQHRAFQAAQLTAIEKLEALFPGLDFEDEKAIFKGE